jgi:hypothetical protein
MLLCNITSALEKLQALQLEALAFKPGDDFADQTPLDTYRHIGSTSDRIYYRAKGCYELQAALYKITLTIGLDHHVGYFVLDGDRQGAVCS